MTKQQFAARLAVKLHLTNREAIDIINGFVDSIKEALLSGQEVNLQGFGKFVVTPKKARNGINPRTGEKIIIPAYTGPAFKAGKPFRNAIRDKFINN